MTREYVYLGSKLLASIESGTTTTWYHVDVLGSVRAITSSAGATLTRHDYAPFGESTSSLSGDPRRFTGQQLDAETALDYYNARYYRNVWGRFTTADDSIYMDTADPQSFNVYAYVFNNPLRWVDPSGHSAQDPACPPNTCTTVIAPPVFGDVMAAEDQANFFLRSLHRLRQLFQEAALEAEVIDDVNAELAGIDSRTRRELGLPPCVCDLQEAGAGPAANYVYRLLVNGRVRYVGITNNFARRAAEQARRNGWEISYYMSNLTRLEARAVEQALIVRFGFGSQGGTLLNRINSISPVAPEYAALLTLGRHLSGIR